MKSIYECIKCPLSCRVEYSSVYKPQVCLHPTKPEKLPEFNEVFDEESNATP